MCHSYVSFLLLYLSLCVILLASVSLCLFLFWRIETPASLVRPLTVPLLTHKTAKGIFGIGRGAETAVMISKLRDKYTKFRMVDAIYVVNPSDDWYYGGISYLDGILHFDQVPHPFRFFPFILLFSFHFSFFFISHSFDN